MPFRIVRNDITTMNCDAIVNTANRYPVVGDGCDRAVYRAAGYQKLMAAREKIGEKQEGEAFLTPGFDLPAAYIIHTISPLFKDGRSGEEEKLRNCYRNSLAIAAKQKLKSIAFPLIATGSFGYPRIEGMYIALEEIREFLETHPEMLIYLVVFDENSTSLSRQIFSDLDSYIDSHYVEEKEEEEYILSTKERAYDYYTSRENDGDIYPFGEEEVPDAFEGQPMPSEAEDPWTSVNENRRMPAPASPFASGKPEQAVRPTISGQPEPIARRTGASKKESMLKKPGKLLEDVFWKDKTPKKKSQKDEEEEKLEQFNRGLEERMAHLSDTFTEYLLYLIDRKGLDHVEVYKNALIDKKAFSKIKNNPDAHPQKRTVLCLCVGAKLSLDETKDLLARAGYALSPCDKTDVIFSYFIERGNYNIIDIDLQLEEYGLSCLIS